MASSYTDNATTSNGLLQKHNARVNGSSIKPQSPTQQYLWELNRRSPGLHSYNVALAWRLQGQLNGDALQAALRALQDRHEMLRATFSSENTTEIHSTYLLPKLDVIKDIREEDLDAILQKDAEFALDLQAGPAWRCGVYRIGEFDSVLSITLHRIVGDWQSVAIFQNDLATFYNDALNTRDSSISNPLAQRDSSSSSSQRWNEPRLNEQVQRRTQHVEDGRKQGEAITPAEIPLDKPRTPTPSQCSRKQTIKIDNDVYHRLLDFRQDHDTLTRTVLLAAFRAAHYRLTGLLEGAIGVQNASRCRHNQNAIGPFATVQSIPMQLEEDESFKSLIQQTHIELGKLLENENAASPERLVVNSPSTRIVFTHDIKQEVHADLFDGLTLTNIEAPSAHSIYDIEVHCVEQGQTLNVTAQYTESLFYPETIQNMLSIFSRVLKGCLLSPDQPLSLLPLFTLRDWDQLDNLGLLQMQAIDYPRESSVVDVFKQQTQIVPDKVAVKDSSTSLTYKELDHESDRVALWLLGRQLPAETIIAVFASRSCESIVSFLGILKANMAYLPLDIRAPTKRLNTILSSIAAPRIVLVGSGIVVPELGVDDTTYVPIRKLIASSGQDLRNTNLLTTNKPSATSLAYVMFTSGSTGQPKGVMIEHRGIVRLVKNSNIIEHILPSPTIAHTSNLSFDASTWDIYAALLNGGTVVCVDHLSVIDTESLPEIFQRESITHTFFTPAILRQYVRECPRIFSTLKSVCVGGDRVDLRDVEYFRTIPTKLINVYGPTENTTFSSSFCLDPDGVYPTSIPIGRALSNSGAFVMDTHLRLVPVGVVGELVVTGDGLARGYLDPSNDAGRFVKVSIAGQMVRGYRTGDFARYRPCDGQLEFLGRIDAQVKIRGHRVELGEIENFLTSHSDVADSAVIVQEMSDTKDLLAFITLPPIEPPVDNADDIPQAEQSSNNSVSEHVEMWENTFDADIYRSITNVENTDVGRDFVGWTSMYNGKNIDKDEMNEWLDDTIDTITTTCDPQHVLEIGSGSGMILFNLPDTLKSYIGLDPSHQAVNFVAETASSIPRLSSKTRVIKGSAMDVRGLKDVISPGTTVVVNSVAQYFPSQQYLFNLIELIVRDIPNITTIFFGDIRSQALYRQFLVTKILHLLGEDLSKESVRQRLEDMERSELEFLVDPAFFTSLTDSFPNQIEHVEIIPKTMRATNELSCYRYSAVLHIANRSQREQRLHVHQVPNDGWIDYDQNGLNRDSLLKLLKDHTKESTLCVSNIPYGKTILERYALNAIDETDGDDGSHWLRRARQAAANCPFLSPVDLVSLADEAGCRVEVSWSRQFSQRGALDVIFHRLEASRSQRIVFNFPTEHRDRSQQTLTSHPWLQQRKQKIHRELYDAMQAQLPNYMIPRAVTFIDKIPLNNNGKIDKQVLLNMKPHMNVSPSHVAFRKPVTEAEQQMQGIWSRVLNIDASGIGLDDNFFQLGGTSITAMQVASEVRAKGQSLSIVKIFRSPSLESMASNTVANVETSNAIPPYSLLPANFDLDIFFKDVLAKYQLHASNISDVYPCTPLQAGLFFLTLKRPGDYISQAPMRIPDYITTRQLQNAIETVVQANPVLRSRIVSYNSDLFQLVVEEDVEWKTASSLQDYLQADRELSVAFGQPLARYALVTDEEKTRWFVWSIHHSRFDHWSMSILMDSINAALDSLPIPTGPSFTSFIQYTVSQDAVAQVEFWKTYLDGFNPTVSFPALPTMTFEPRTDTVIATQLPIVHAKNLNITHSSLIRGAWALIAAQMSESLDVVFGATLFGRNSPVAGVEKIAGPTFASVPIRVRVDRQESIKSYLLRIHREATEMMPFEQTGLNQISQISPNCQQACQFQTLLVVQAFESALKASKRKLDFDWQPDKTNQQQWFNPYALTLEVLMGGEEPSVKASFDSRVVSPLVVKSLLKRLENVLKQFSHMDPNQQIEEVELFTAHDLHQIQEWNGPEIKPSQKSLNDMLMHSFKNYGEREAVFTTDGSLTYAELDKSTELLAAHIVSLQVPANTIIPICFSSSKWAVIAMLGILRARCVFMPLDPTHPEHRRKTLVQEVGAKMIITSTDFASKCSFMNENVIELSESFFSELHAENQALPSLSASMVAEDDVAYILFTSGSTGKPKGVVVQHSAICTSIESYISKYGHDESPRTLQFSSYVFDACIYEIFMTLGSGGTVCIPSASERLQNIEAFMMAARVTFAMLTPSFVKILQPKALPTLQTLMLIGEPPILDVVNLWKKRLCLLNGYGPTETLVLSNVWRFDPDGSPMPSTTIGKTLHGHGWIVDPNNHDQLVPIGCSGELVIQSSALAHGYYNDPSRTSAVFYKSMRWLSQSKESDLHRFYKTGDLVRYGKDGVFEYIGRKDTQIKLRGQRLELGEIEYGIQASASNIKHAVVQRTKRGTGEFLVAFIELNQDESQPSTAVDCRILEVNHELQSTIANIDDSLKLTLPSYMVPTFYLPVSKTPFSSSMKIDRNYLQRIADATSVEALAEYSPSSNHKTEPVTEKETLLRDLWAQILSISPTTIGRHDSYLHIGGDSINAIHLSVLAQEHGLDIPVSTIFNSARLSTMAEAAVEFDASSRHVEAGPAPFSLLQSNDINNTIRMLRKYCNLRDTETIQDAYPCTPLQEGLLALGVKHPGSYIAKQVFRLGNDIDIFRFKAAWEHIYNICDNQRQRIVTLNELSIEVLVGGDFAWETTDGLGLTQFLELAKTTDMSYGSKLTRSAIVQESTGEKYFVWVNHHAIFDGWTISLILTALKKVYHGIDTPSFVPYSKFIEYATQMDQGKARDYWKEQLRGARRTNFPPHRSVTAPSDANKQVTRLVYRTFPFPPTKSSITKGTILRAAWAIVVARYDNSDDVCFGATAAGRNANVAGVERIAGAVIGTVPVRIRIDAEKPVVDFLSDVQRQMLDMVPYEQTGFQNIMRINEDTRQAADVTSLLIVQPEQQIDAMTNAASDIMTKPTEEEYSYRDTIEGYFTFPIAIQCQVHRDSVTLEITYDSSVVNSFQMDAICHHYETVAQGLHKHNEETTPVKDILLTSSWDVDTAKQFNSHVSESIVSSCLHHLIGKWAVETPEKEAIFSTETSITFARLDLLSNLLALHLLEKGVRLETVVPICLEKSIWMPIAMLGITKAGGVFLPMDPTHPHARRQYLVAQVNAHHMVTTTSTSASREGLVKNVISLSEDFFQQLEVHYSSQKHLKLPQIAPSNAAYILFTSGSTGQPKGICVEHTAICSSILSHGREFRLTPSSRVLQFASYIFDVSVSEILTTLVFGGTVCIPTPSERMGDIAGFINRSRVDVAMLTPSFVTTFNPKQVPNLKTLILGGEAPTKRTLSTWQPHLRLLNGYAPAECCIYALSYTYKSEQDIPTLLGKGLHVNCWIVDPDNHDMLAPIGCVGELVIQTNTMGRGYVGDDAKTAQSFLGTVGFIPQEFQDPRYRFYKSGDLVKYNQNGEIEYLGRKDTQVKLRGQRIELGEIEHHVESLLPEAKYVAVEVLRRQSREALIAFISFRDTDHEGANKNEHRDSNDIKRSFTPLLKAKFQRLAQDLRGKLPQFMIPTLFMPISQMPFLGSLKVDRKMLRAMAGNLTGTEMAQLSLADSQTTKETPTTENELKMCQLWAQVLNIEPEAIGKEDSFFQLGGDSIAAVQLLLLARSNGIFLNITNIFANPTLTSMTASGDQEKESTEASGQTKPFALLPHEQLHEIQQEACNACHVRNISEIEDIFPCTSLQESLFARSQRQSGAYMGSIVFQVASGIDVDVFKAAWENTVKVCGNMRTRIIMSPYSGSGRPLQVLIRSPPMWEETDGLDLQSYLTQPSIRHVTFGTTLCRYGLLRQEERTYFILTLHHAIYDLWTVQIMLKSLGSIYRGVDATVHPYRDFVEYGLSKDNPTNRQYWQEQLQGVQRTSFPQPKGEHSATGKPATQSMRTSLPFPHSAKSSMTRATFIRAAWAIILSQYGDTSDVCFGSTVSGRLAPLVGVTNMPGPTIATIPVRLQLDKDQSIANFLSYVQSHSTEAIPHEQFGLQNIADIGPDAKNACDFGSLLVIQPVQKVLSDVDNTQILQEDESDMTRNLLEGQLQNHYNFPLIINCILTDDDTLDLLIYYDVNYVNEAELLTLRDHFGDTISHLMDNEQSSLASINLGISKTRLQTRTYSHSKQPSARATASLIEKPSNTGLGRGDQPTTSMEMSIRNLWATVLSMEETRIGKNDSFLSIGGDSIDAIRLVSLARQRNIYIPIDTIFKTPRLLDTVAASSYIQDAAPTSVEPFALLRHPVSDSSLQDISTQCQVHIDAIEDVYPCTALQEGLFALSLKSPGAYVAHFTFQLAATVNSDAFKLAWERVFEATDIMRTRIILLDGENAQVVLKEKLEWTQFNDLRTYTEQASRLNTGYGSPLSRFALINDEYFVWTMHHAIEDGWTVQLILDQLEKVYKGLEPPILAPFNLFIKHKMELNIPEAQKYWRNQLEGSTRTVFPQVLTGQPPKARHRETIQFHRPADTSVTTATILRASWAILLASYCDTNDVCFGTIVTGRQTSLGAISEIAGPTIATVPVRLQLDYDQSVAQFLSHVQNHTLQMAPYEQFGLQNIARLSQDAREACDFSSLFTIQPTQIAEGVEANTVLTEYCEDQNAPALEHTFHTLPLVISVLMGTSTIQFDIQYAPSLLSEFRIQSIVRHLDCIIKQLSMPGNGYLRDISVAGEWDLRQSIAWNTEDLSTNDSCLHDLISRHASEIPDNEALYSTERSLTWAEFEKLTDRLAVYLREQGVVPETIVPFCFEKSIWAVVSIVAILKAGGAFMPMDPSHPNEYLQNLVQKADARILLVSTSTKVVCGALAELLIEVHAEAPFFQTKDKPCTEVLQNPPVKPNNAAYVLFSSGSTGVPKGVVNEHRAFAVALKGQSDRYNISRKTRFLQFANYVFDASCREILTTLGSGATLCIPTEEERLQDTADFITRARCNVVNFTPSFAKIIEPCQVPTVESVLLGGEAVTSDLVETWASKKILRNCYGPAEASVNSVSHRYLSSNDLASTIGKPLNNGCWVVDLRNPDRLAPVGCVGELILQGPAIARGYLKDPERTQKSFSSSVKFLPEDIVQKSPRFYRTGDLVSWLSDGTLTYVGRRDLQVKLRGQRIELGAIESKILQTGDDVEHVAVDVIQRGSIEGLVAFISFQKLRDLDAQTHSSIIPSTDATRTFFADLMARLSNMLPRYMLPSFYIPVTAMPYSTSGKIDRKTLKALMDGLSFNDLASHATSHKRSFRDCSNHIERRVRMLWADTLGLEVSAISVDDNFYDLGGDSIKIVTLMKRLRDEFNFHLSVSMMNSRTTTIEAISKLIDNHEPEETSVDLFNEIQTVLSSSWVKQLQTPKLQLETTLPEDAVVFLTGASGFLGTQLLRQLLKVPRVKRVVALVRAVTAERGLERLKRAGVIAEWWEDGCEDRIEVWTGDLDQERLGLTNQQWERLCGTSAFNNVNAIVHNGASVNWNADYDKLRRPNVQSVITLLKAAVTSPCTPKFVFVSGGSHVDLTANQERVAKEMAKQIGYSQAKYVAETIVYSVASQLPLEQNRFSVVKPGKVIGTAEEGISNVDDFVWRMVAAASRLKFCPSIDNNWMAVADAGFVASRVLGQLFEHNVLPYVDVAKASGLPTAEFWDLVNGELEHPCEPLTWNDWVGRALDEMSQVGAEHPLWPVQHFLVEEDFSEPETLNNIPPSDTLRIAIKENVRYLQRVGFIQSGGNSYAQITKDVLRRS